MPTTIERESTIGLLSVVVLLGVLIIIVLAGFYLLEPASVLSIQSPNG